MLRNNRFTYIPAAVLFLLASYFDVDAQVQIAPTSIFMSDERQTERLTIRNTSNHPQEISIELLYGYPATDESGQAYLKTFGAIPDGAPAASEWIRVYPRHLILPPHQQQVVRFSARPPAGILPGEYWARPAISISAASEPHSDHINAISTRIHFINRTVLSLNYRHKRVQTGITIESMHAETTGNKLYLWAELQRQGSAAFLGSARISIYKDAEEVLHQQQDIAVYYSQRRRFSFDINSLSSGTYSFRLSLSTSDRAARQPSVLPAPPTEQSIEFEI